MKRFGVLWLVLTTMLCCCITTYGQAINDELNDDDHKRIMHAIKRSLADFKQADQTDRDQLYDDLHRALHLQFGLRDEQESNLNRVWPMLIHLAQHPDRDVRAVIPTLLEKSRWDYFNIETEAINQLVKQLLNDEDDLIVAFTCELLSLKEFGAIEFHDELINLLSHDGASVRMAAIDAFHLQEQRSLVALSAIIERLKLEKNPDLKGRLYHCIGSISRGRHGGIEILEEAIVNGTPRIRRSAIYALQYCQPEEESVVALLHQYIDLKDWKDREALFYVLGNLGDVSYSYLLEYLSDTEALDAAEAIEALRKCSAVRIDVDDLMRMWWNTEDAEIQKEIVRYYFVSHLKHLPDFIESHLTAILKQRSPVSPELGRVLNVIMSLDESAAMYTPSLIEIIQDRNLKHQYRLKAMSILSHDIQSAETIVPILWELAFDENRRISSNACIALFHFRDQHSELLQKLMSLENLTHTQVMDITIALSGLVQGYEEAFDYLYSLTNQEDRPELVKEFLRFAPFTIYTQKLVFKYLSLDKHVLSLYLLDYMQACDQMQHSLLPFILKFSEHTNEHIGANAIDYLSAYAYQDTKVSARLEACLKMKGSELRSHAARVLLQMEAVPEEVLKAAWRSLYEEKTWVYFYSDDLTDDAIRVGEFLVPLLIQDIRGNPKRMHRWVSNEGDYLIKLAPHHSAVHELIIELMYTYRHQYQGTITLLMYCSKLKQLDSKYWPVLYGYILDEGYDYRVRSAALRAVFHLNANPQGLIDPLTQMAVSDICPVMQKYAVVALHLIQPDEIYMKQLKYWFDGQKYHDRMYIAEACIELNLWLPEQAEQLYDVLVEMNYAFSGTPDTYLSHIVDKAYFTQRSLKLLKHDSSHKRRRACLILSYTADDPSSVIQVLQQVTQKDASHRVRREAHKAILYLQEQSTAE